MSTTETQQEQAAAPAVDYDLARTWLAEEGHYRADLQTAEQLRKVARELLTARPAPTAPQDAVPVLEAWEAIGHDTGCNPSKDELLASLRYMAELIANHAAPHSGLSGMVNIRRDLLERIDESAICDGTECSIDSELFLELCAALNKQGSAGV